MSRRRTVVNVVVLLVVLLVFYWIGKAIYGHLHKSERQGFPPAPVEVATAEAQKWQDQIHTTGTISAIQGVMIKPEVGGRITKIYFLSGANVQKGDPLFQIYPDIVEARLANDQAALSLAQVNYDRAIALYQKKVVSKESLDQYTSALQQAQANLNQTKAQLVQLNIVAPFSGRIGLKMVDVGDYVNIGESLVELQKMNPLRVQFSVPDRYINQLKIGDKVQVTASSAANTIYSGAAYAFNAAVELSTRSFSMWAKIPNPSQDLIPGTYVDVTMFVGKPHTVVTVPQTAALFSPMGEYVFKVVDNKATKAQVTVGERLGDLVEIKTGLKAGDVVITAGQVKVFDGSSVIVTKTKTYPANKTPQPTIISSPETDSAVSPETDELAVKSTAKSVVNNNAPAANATIATTNTPSATPADVNAAPSAAALPASSNFSNKSAPASAPASAVKE